MYCGYITTIKELRKHENADRLQVCTVFGNNVIVDLTYQVGQKVVYFPSDGQLSEEFCADNNLVRCKDENGNSVGGYLDPNKRNVTAIKLRGEKSDGLILPIERLTKYTDISKLADGDQITVLNGHEICRKYIPRTNHQNHQVGFHNIATNKKELSQIISYPFFTEHIDTEQLAYNEKAFKVGDTIYLTQKLHGTSFRVGNCVEVTTKKRPVFIKRLFRCGDKVTKAYHAVSGTRRTVLRGYDGGYYGSNQFRQKYTDFFEQRLPKGYTVYGEIVGWIDENTPIMPRCDNSKIKDKEFSRKYGDETIFTYGCKPGENDCYIYRITATNEDGYVVEVPTEEVARLCELWGCKYVPLLEKFLYTTWEDLNERCAKYCDIPEQLANGSHITEGVVVRIDNRSKFTAYKTKGFYFKCLSGIATDSLTDEQIDSMGADLLSEI